MSALSPDDVQREAKHHFDLYYALRKRVGDGESWGVDGKLFDGVEPELPTETGFADLVVYDGLDPWLVIECKKLVKSHAIEKFDPYSQTVIDQANRYADDLNASFIATYDGQTLVLSHAGESKSGVLDRRTISYSESNFASKEELIFAVLEDTIALGQGADHWDSAFNALVNRLGELHQFIYPRLQEALEEHLSDDEEFREIFVEWLNEQGITYKEAWINNKELSTRKRRQRQRAHADFAKQDAYLWINQLLFYEILEDTSRFATYSSQTAYERSGREDKILTMRALTADELDFLQEYIRSRFDQIVSDVDYEAVFSQDDVFGTVPYTERVADTINDFIDELAEYDLSSITSDFLGRTYEQLIPTEERRDLGEFYTPPKVARLITQAILRDPEEFVLDPAVGTGTFLAEVYDWKREHGDLSHQEIVDQLAGIDVNRFAAHLAVINLTRQNLDAETENTNVLINDFFKTSDEQHLLSAEEAALERRENEGFDASQAKKISDVDAIVGNPPYITWTNIEHRDQKREHLPAEYARSGSKYISKKSDIYQYFFTKSVEWLDNGGRVGFLTSYKWSTIRSGEGLQEYFLDNTRILGVIDLGKSIFEDAFVKTYITLLEKCDGATDNDDKETAEVIEAERDRHEVPFIRVEEELPVNQIVELLDSNISHQGDGYRVILRRQAELRDERKWHRFLIAPTEYFEVVNHSKVTTLPEICDVSQSTGTKTQADTFFVINEAEKQEWDIPEEYLSLGLMSKSQIDDETFLFHERDTNQWFLDLHDITAEVIEDIQNSPLVGGGVVERPSNIENAIESRLRERLRNNGHNGLADYLIYGREELELPSEDKSANIYSRGDTWWDLGELARPALVVPETRHGRPGVIWNSDRVAVKDTVRPFYSEIGDEKVLAGILNSSLGRIFIETHGRISGKQAIRMLVYDLKTLPVIDPRKIDEAGKIRIREAFDEWVHADVPKSFDEKLDRAVLSVLDTPNDPEHETMEHLYDQFHELAERMVQNRKENFEVELLIGEDSETGVTDLSNVLSESAQMDSSLSDYIDS